MQAWKTLSRQIVLDRGKFLRVEDHTVELPDGRVIEQWPWIITPDFINVVALTDDDKMLCFRQGKYAIEGEALAPVGGYLEPGEEPLVAAQRELLEETGITATKWTKIQELHLSNSASDEFCILYIAQELNFGESQPEDEEQLEIRKLHFDELYKMIESGEITDSLTVAIVLKAKLMMLEGKL